MYLKSNSFLRITALNFFLVGFKIILGMILIPILINTLGKERFGVWQTILSFSTLASVLNLGFGNGLRNIITKLVATESNDIGKYIGVTIKKVFKLIFLITLVLLPLIYFFFNPDSFFKNSTLDSSEIKISVIIFSTLFLFNIVLSISDSISFGLQKSYIPNIVQAIHFFLLLIFLLAIDNYYEINLIYLSLLFGILLSIIYVVVFIVLNKKFNIKISFKSKINIKEVNNLSFLFFLAQFTSLLFISIDTFVLSNKLGAEVTAEYSVIYKIFFVIISVFSVFLIHYWNRVTEAFQKGEKLWIKKTANKLVILAIVFFLISIVISVFQKKIISFWLGESLNFQNLSFYLFSFYLLLHCINAIFVNIQNGIGLIKAQIIGNVIVLIVYFLAINIIDLDFYGYNALIIIKTILMLILVIINFSIFKVLKNDSVS